MGRTLPSRTAAFPLVNELSGFTAHGIDAGRDTTCRRSRAVQLAIAARASNRLHPPGFAL